MTPHVVAHRVDALTLAYRVDFDAHFLEANAPRLLPERDGLYLLSSTVPRRLTVHHNHSWVSHYAHVDKINQRGSEILSVRLVEAGFETSVL